MNSQQAMMAAVDNAEPEAVSASRFDFLCRATEIIDNAGARDEKFVLLQKFLRQDLRQLAEQESPPDFLALSFALEQELERLRQFSDFPHLAEKVVVAFGGAFSAGKSSLINALFGQVTAATDVLPDTTTEWTPYRLKHDGLDAALIFDAPAYDSAALNGKKLRQAVLEADLLLWVSAVNKPGDRDGERKALDQVRGWQKERANLHPAPLLVAVSHIDRLRPAKEWQPPYDLQNPNGPKASNIQAAVMAVATDLAVPIGDVIPVCLAEGRIYNVDDALWAALLDRQDEANKVRLLRCQQQQKQGENWTLLRQQLTSTGRWLLKWPGKALG